MTMKNGRYWPKCACTEDENEEYEMAVEQRVLTCSAAATMSAFHNRDNLHLCGASDDYIMITIITSMVCGMSITAEGGAQVDEAAFERVLSTLVGDVRARRASMEGLNNNTGVKH